MRASGYSALSLRSTSFPYITRSRKTQMKRILIIIAQYAILSLLLIYAPLQRGAEPQATMALRVTLQPVKKIYRPGEKIRVSYSVKNVGPDPILIPLAMRPVME